MMLRITILFILFFSNSAILAQSKHPNTIGLNFFNNNFYQLHGKFLKNPGISLQYLSGLSRCTDFFITMGGSFPDRISDKAAGEGNSLFLQSDLQLRFRFSDPQQKAQPFLTTGIGVAAFHSSYPVYASIGPGFQYAFKNFYVLTAVQFRPGIAGTVSHHLQYSIGFAGTLFPKKVPPKVQANKSPAPALPILRDSDGDGILDSLDACPYTPGISKFQGCPDTDADGIEDRKDSCANVYGLPRYHGCPIPDTDRDGINDEADSCLLVKGIAALHGCPPPDPAIQQLHGFASRIYFQTGSYKLLQSSLPVLDSIVYILKFNPDIKVHILGHTDNVGKAAANLLLSQKRADHVMNYLVQKGIFQYRLKASGFGDTKPLENNITKENRQKNRRVEFKIYKD